MSSTATPACVIHPRPDSHLGKLRTGTGLVLPGYYNRTRVHLSTRPTISGEVLSQVHVAARVCQCVHQNNEPARADDSSASCVFADARRRVRPGRGCEASAHGWQRTPGAGLRPCCGLGRKQLTNLRRTHNAASVIIKGVRCSFQAAVPMAATPTRTFRVDASRAGAQGVTCVRPALPVLRPVSVHRRHGIIFAAT